VQSSDLDTPAPTGEQDQRLSVSKRRLADLDFTSCQLRFGDRPVPLASAIAACVLTKQLVPTMVQTVPGNSFSNCFA